MEVCNCFVSVRKPPVHLYRRSSTSLSNPPETRVRVSKDLQRETEKTLEWHSICSQISAFTSTAMGLSVSRTAKLPFGGNLQESMKLLNQTMAAILLPQPLDFSGIGDISEIVRSSVNGELCSVGELCAVERSLRSARGVYEQLGKVSSKDESFDRYLCHFELGLELLYDGF